MHARSRPSSDRPSPAALHGTRRSRLVATAIAGAVALGTIGGAATAAEPVPGVPVETPPVPALPPEAAPVQDIAAPTAFAVCVTGLSAVIIGAGAVGLATALGGVAPVPALPVSLPVPLSPATYLAAAAQPLGLTCTIAPVPATGSACPVPGVGEVSSLGLPITLPDPLGIAVDTIARAEYQAGTPSAPSATLKTQLGCAQRPF